MTREELIEMLNILLDNAKVGCADITTIHHVSLESFKFVVEQAIKALEQQPCDTWSIKDVADAFERNGIMKQQPCEDAVSREAALKEAYSIVIDGDKFDVVQVETLLGLPSVTQKSGKWITKPHVYGVAYCSECGFELRIDDTKYCPDCGAKMESEVNNG